VKNVKFKNPGAAPLPTPMVTRRVESQALRVRIIYSFFESIQSLVTTTVESLLVIGFQAQVIVDSNEIWNFPCACFLWLQNGSDGVL